MPGSESGGSSICNEIYDPTIWQQCIDKYFSPDVNFRPRLSMKRGEIPDSLCCATSDLCYTTNGLRFCFVSSKLARPQIYDNRDESGTCC